MPETVEQAIARVTKGWSDTQVAALMNKLHRESTRARVSQEYPSPGLLARYCDPTTVQTPALDKIDEAIECALTTRSSRTLITMPPQEGKSTRVGVWTPVRALQLDPERRVVLVSFAESLAQESSRAARNIINEYGSEAKDPLSGIPMADKLGLSLADDKSAAGHWRIKGHKGGMYVAGIEGGVTGRPADLLIIDDPFKGMAEADSAAQRAKVIAFWQAVALTRLAPGAPVIIIQTRWHEQDLAGHLLAQDKLLPNEHRTWNVVNLPAISEEGVPDALNREAGEYLQSARGRTPADWEDTKRAVGPRVWSALYQGQPTPSGGGLFSKDDFNRYRVAQSGNTVMRLVSVDPAETGKRDEAGVIGAAATTDGRVLWTHDWSGRMTSDQWARKAVLMALTIGAAEIAYEAYTTEQTYKRVLMAAWRDIRDEARLIRAAGGDLEIAATAMATLEDAPADPLGMLRQLDGLNVPDQTDPPFRLHAYRGKGDKAARATGSRQASSTGRLRIVGTLTVLENQATTWQLGQNSPDRMDAAVNAYNRLCDLTGHVSTIVTPGQATGLAAPTAAQGGIAALLATPMRMTDRA